jgi:hypothetical protein
MYVNVPGILKLEPVAVLRHDIYELDFVDRH